VELTPGQLMTDLRTRKPVQIIQVLELEELHLGREVLRRYQIATRCLEDGLVRVDVFGTKVRQCTPGRGEWEEFIP